jgi:hypothetical protein
MYTVAEVSMTKNITLLTLITAAVLLAADVWTKAPADWSPKDVEKILTDSPWADRMQIETGQRGMIGNADDGKGAMQGNLTAPVTVMWRTALPIRQAIAKSNPTPANENEPTVSVLLLSGFPGQFRADASDVAKLTADTVIKVKGKPDIHPTTVELPPAPAFASKGGPGAPGAVVPGGAAPAAGAGGGKGGAKGGFGGGPSGFGGGTFNLVMAFPKNLGLAVEDKEFELQTKVGKMTIRKKFKLQDMVYSGKLEL